MSELFYKTYGEGAIDVLMIHGWASSQSMWKHVHPHLRNAKAWGIDLHGFGHTPIGGSALTVDAHVESVIKFCDRHVKPQMIIAHSMGGLVTLKLLDIRPDLAEQVVLICPVVTGKFSIFGSLAQEVMRSSIAVNALRASRSLWPTIQNAWLLSATAPLLNSNEELAEQMKDNFLLTRPEAGIEAIISIAKQDMKERLCNIKQDALVCITTGDTTVPHTEGRTAVELMPNAEIFQFTESRHHPMDEEPEKFAEIFRGFVSRYGL